MVNTDAIVPRGTDKQVFVIRPGRGDGQMAIPVAISTGLERGAEVEIRSAELKAGDLVVCRANERLFGPTPVIPTPLAQTEATSQPTDEAPSENPTNQAQVSN